MSSIFWKYVGFDMRKPVTYYMPVCVTDFDTLHPNTTPKHYTLVGFFIFFFSPGTCPKLCSSTRNVDCAAPFPLLCINRHAYACHFLGGGDFKLRFTILTPTKTTRKAATMRFVVSPCVLGCIKGSYAGLFREFNFNLNF